MRIRPILLAGASLLAMTAHASADPVSIGFALFAGPLGSVFSFSALVGFASLLPTIVGVGLALGSALLRGGQAQQAIDPGQYRGTFESSEASEVNAIGRCMLGGLKVFGNTKLADRWRLIGHARGPLVAVEEYRIGGRTVVVESDGRVSSPPYAQPGNESYIRIATKVGDGSETAWPDLLTAFPSLWTSDHRVRGIAQSLIQYISPGLDTEAGIAKFNKLYQGGEPDEAIIGRWNTCYDPRDGGQDPDDADTWEWSDNGILCAARIMLEYPELTVDNFDWSDIALEADKADVTVATLTGTEARSRCSGVWLSESTRGDTMQQVLDSIGAEIQMSDDGKIRIRLVDDAPTSEGTLPVKHALEWTWKSGPDAVERPNVCRVKYYSPERNYELADIDLSGLPWANVQSEIDRYGEKVMDISLPFCPSASQAQRIARRLFLLARADTGQSVTNWDGLWAWGRSYAEIEFPDLDESPLCKLEPPRIDDANGQVEIPYAVWPQELIDEEWNPATMEAPAPEVVPELVYESEIAAPTAGSPVLVQYPGGSYEMRFPYSVPGGTAVAQAIYRTYTGGNPDAWASMTEISSPSYAWAAGGSVGATVDFRAQVFDDEDNPSDWSDTVQVALAIDNSALSAPSVSATAHNAVIEGGAGPVDGVTLSISSLPVRAVRLLVESNYDGAGWTTELDNASYRPNGTADVLVDGFTNGTLDDKTLEWRVSAFTSNGVQSTYASGSQVIAGEPGP